MSLGYTIVTFLGGTTVHLLRGYVLKILLGRTPFLTVFFLIINIFLNSLYIDVLFWQIFCVKYNPNIVMYYYLGLPKYWFNNAFGIELLQIPGLEWRSVKMEKYMLCAPFAHGSKSMVVTSPLEMSWSMCYRYSSREYVLCFRENLMKMNHCVSVDFTNGPAATLF